MGGHIAFDDVQEERMDMYVYIRPALAALALVLYQKTEFDFLLSVFCHPSSVFCLLTLLGLLSSQTSLVFMFPTFFVCVLRRLPHFDHFLLSLPCLRRVQEKFEVQSVISAIIAILSAHHVDRSLCCSQMCLPVAPFIGLRVGLSWRSQCSYVLPDGGWSIDRPRALLEVSRVPRHS